MRTNASRLTQLFSFLLSGWRLRYLRSVNSVGGMISIDLASLFRSDFYTQLSGQL